MESESSAKKPVFTQCCYVGFYRGLSGELYDQEANTHVMLQRLYPVAHFFYFFLSNVVYQI